MAEVTERRATTVDHHVLRERRRLNRRIWLFTVGLLINVVVIYSAGTMYGSISLTVGLAACVLFPACAWGIYLAHEERSGLPLPVTERVSVMRSEKREPQMQLVQRNGSTLKLTGFSFTARQWRQIANNLAAQQWLFNRDAFTEVLENYTATWADFKGEWESRGYVYKNGRSWYVHDWVRHALTDSPYPNRNRIVSGWIVGDNDDDDHDDDE